MNPNSAAADRGTGVAAPQGAGDASTETLTLSIDGQAVRARRGATLLEAASAAGIHIPTLCHHDALEPHGACRLCVVDIRRPGWSAEPRMVAACLYPVEDGLVVLTGSGRVRAARREILDLLLARCPESPRIRRLALDYGIRETSYRRNAEHTDCILCGLCTRLCDRLGPAAISLVGRGIGREVAPPFHEPPPDCVGCLACSLICPAGHIPFTRSDGGHSIWGRTFPRLRCPTCGRAHITEAEADYCATRTGLTRADLEKCDTCKRAATAKTVARLAAIG